MQALAEIISEKKANKPPVIIAPKTLVAANSIAKSTRESKMVPKTPISKAPRAFLAQQKACRALVPTAIKRTVRKATAVPKAVHKNAVPTEIVAIKVKIAVVIPIIMLAAIAMTKQLFLFSHLVLSINSPPD